MAILARSAVWTAPHRENDNVSVSYFIRYVGVPKDVAAFLEHYRLRHSRIMREYPASEGAVCITRSNGTIR